MDVPVILVPSVSTVVVVDNSWPPATAVWMEAGLPVVLLERPRWGEGKSARCRLLLSDGTRCTGWVSWEDFVRVRGESVPMGAPQR